MDTQAPAPQQLETVETSLYNRMVRNAFIGFMKSAVIGAAIGIALGGLAAAGIHAGNLPALSFFGDTAGGIGSAMLAGALKGAAWFAGIAGSFGAVAGIQSTRDTRRFFQLHEGHEASIDQAPERTLAIQQEKTEPSGNRYQAMLAKEAEKAPAGIILN